MFSIYLHEDVSNVFVARGGESDIKCPSVKPVYTKDR